MPLRRAPRRARRAPRKQRRAKKANPSRSITIQNQVATCMETSEFKSLNVNSLYQHFFNLGQFPRSSAIAACYRYYRPVEVRYEYTPYYNTFQENVSGGGVTVPTMLSYMDRTGDSNQPFAVANQLKWIESTGAQPKMFTKKVVIKYRPNWLSSGVLTWSNETPGGPITGLSSMGAKAEYSWLPCPDIIDQALTSAGAYALEPNGQVNVPQSAPQGLANVGNNRSISVSSNGVNFHGHTTYFQQDVDGVNSTVCDLRVVVKWEFKGPNPQFYNFNVRDPPPASADPLVVQA